MRSMCLCCMARPLQVDSVKTMKNIKDESKATRYGRYSCKKIGFKTEYSKNEYQFESSDYFTYRE